MKPTDTSLGRTHEDVHEPSPCPECGYELDSVSGVATDDAPVPGDYTVCISCAAVLVFGDDLKPRRPADAEIKAMPAPARYQISRVRQAIRQLAEGKAKDAQR